MSEKLTIKQKKFVKEYIETGNATESAARSYDVSSRASAGQIGYENLIKLEEPIAAVMDRVGLTDDFIMKCLEEDIRLKPQNRKAELELAVKVKGKLTDKTETRITLEKPLLGGNSIEEDIDAIQGDNSN